MRWCLGTTHYACKCKCEFAAVQRPRGYIRAACRAAAAAEQQMRPKTALITGGNTGIGYETAKALASQGYATVIACRSVEKGQAARARIKQEYPDAKVEAVQLDLANMQSVRDLANKCLDGGRPLDVLINNAGVMAAPRMETQDGFELHFGVNHLGHFLLTTMLLPLLRDNDRPSRILNVSSSAHTNGQINFDDLMGKEGYERWGAYSQSKLANILFTYELAHRLKATKVTVNALHPGVVATELGRYIVPEEPGWFTRQGIKVLVRLIKSPVQGAQTSIYVATSADVEGVTGKYFDDCKLKASSPESYNATMGQRLWNVSMELTSAPSI